jgi:hypothetical protein
LALPENTESKGGIVSSLIDQYNKSGIPLTSGVTKKPDRIKEKGIVIKVKKNEVPQESKDEKINIDENELKDYKPEGLENYAKPTRDFTAIQKDNEEKEKKKEEKEKNKISVVINEKYKDDYEQNIEDEGLEIQPLF